MRNISINNEFSELFFPKLKIIKKELKKNLNDFLGQNPFFFSSSDK